MPFTAAQIRELQNKLGLRNPASLFTKDWYKWFNRNSSGRVPCCQLYHATPVPIGAGGYIAGSGIYERVIMDTDKMSNVGGLRDRITITTPGMYLCSLNVVFSSNVTGNRLIQLMKNVESVTVNQPTPSNAGLGAALEVTTMYLCNTGDYIIGYYWQDGASLSLLELKLSAVLLERI